MTQKEKDLLSEVMWDINFQTLDFKKHRKFILERIMQYGRHEHVNWMLENYSDKDLIETIKSSYNIDNKTANFWSLYFKIPKEDILCFRKSLVKNSWSF